jgi:hypothetical protein
MMREANQRVAHGSATQAAHAIMRLINSRPQSPRHEEIEAIIERLVTRPLLVRQAAPTGLDEYGPDLTTLSS